MFEFNVLKLKNDCFFYNELVWELDQDNTPVGYIEIGQTIFSYEKTNVTGYGDGLKFTTSIDGIPVPCFALLKGKVQEYLKNKGSSKDKVVYYSSFFVLESLNKLEISIQEFTGLYFNYDKATLYRLDVCMDVPLTIKELAPIFIDMLKPSSAIGTDKKHPEFYQTYYLGEIQNKNRNYLIRIYDKVLDTWKKKKGFLYPHLENNYNVRRIELELRPEQAKRYRNYCILDLLNNSDGVISLIFSKYINKKVPEKYHLEEKSLNLIKFPKRNFDLKKHFLQIGHIPKDYVKRTYGYIKKTLHNTGYNGLFQLLFKVEYSDIFLQKNIKSCVINILEGKEFNLMINSKGIQNIDSTLNAGYDFLDELILFLKDSGLENRKINKILKKHTITKIKLKK